ncbi:MAG: hypothetical protein AzoDbin1_02127 [Azoarcus sp.]|nr:hypothetical protein [Azoarcus sp.]
MSRRNNHVLREFVSLVEARLARNAMTIERAAELMLEHGAPAHVVARIIERAQKKHPYPSLIQ